MDFLKWLTTNSLLTSNESKLGRVRRFILPVVISIMMRILTFSWIQRSINLRPDLFSIRFWWETFTIWDGGWYNLIARHGYQNIPTSSELPVQQVFAFLPGFPMVIRFFGLLSGDFTISQVVIASIFVVAWIPLFQLVAEQYLGEEEAFSATIITAFFPTVFLFTSVGYSEGLFLILAISSWFFYLKDRHFLASILVAGASLTRSLGIILIIPMVIANSLNRKFRESLLYGFPLIAQIGWSYYGYMKTGNFFALFYAQRYWYNRQLLTQYMLPTLFQTKPPFSFNLPPNEAFVGLVFCLLSIFILLVLKIYEIDWRLSVYASINLLVIVLCGNIQSYARYLSFIFPIWFLFKTKKMLLLIPVISIMGFFDLFLGYLFARWAFLG